MNESKVKTVVVSLALGMATVSASAMIHSNHEVSLSLHFPKAIAAAETGQDAARVVTNASREAWVSKVEASLANAPFGEIAGEIAPPPRSYGWMGWVFAIALFATLARLSWRRKKQSALLLKGPDYNLILFPPAGNRRKRPR